VIFLNTMLTGGHFREQKSPCKLNSTSASYDYRVNHHFLCSKPESDLHKHADARADFGLEFGRMLRQDHGHHTSRH
jgi:hypothetical protein